MAEEKLLTIRDVSIMLGVSEKEVVDLAENGQIPAYKVGGVYLRFKRAQIEEFRKSVPRHAEVEPSEKGYFFKDRLRDFFYFHDFYLFALLVIILLFIIIFKG
jgi:excisionase family DNA binding protein